MVRLKFIPKIRADPVGCISAGSAMFYFMGWVLFAGIITDSISINIKPADIWPPESITDLSASTIMDDETSLYLSWTSPKEDSGTLTSPDPISRYIVAYASYSGVSYSTTTWWSSATKYIYYGTGTWTYPEFFTLTGLNSGGTYYFAIKSIDDAGHESEVDTKTLSFNQAWAAVYDRAPPVVQNATATQKIDDAKISFSYYTSTPSDFWFFRIYKSIDGINYFALTTTTLNSFTDSNIFTSTGVVKYYVVGVDKDASTNHGLPLESTSYTILKVEDIPPPAPTGFSAIVQNQDVILSWNAINIPEDDIMHYNIYRSSDNQASWVKVSITSSTSYTDQGAAGMGVVLYYRVSASDRGAPDFPGGGTALEGPPANSIEVAAPGIPVWDESNTKAISTNSINWSWIYPSTALTPLGFKIIETGNNTVLIDLPPNTTYWIQTNLTVNTSTRVFVLAYHSNPSYNKSSTPKTLYTFANKPEGLKASTSAIPVPQIELSWQPNNNPPYTDYRIERSPDINFSTYTYFIALATLAYVDTSITPGTTYYYRIRAINNDGILTDVEPPVGSPLEVIAPYPVDFIPPKRPFGLDFSYISGKFIVSWSKVVLSENNSYTDDVNYYKVYISTSLYSILFSTFGVFYSTTNQLSFDVPLDGEKYIRVSAVDNAGNESQLSDVVTTSGSVIANLSKTSIEFTDNSHRVLLKNNTNTNDLYIKITRIPEEEKERVVRSYLFEVYDSSTEKKVSNFTLNLPQLVITLEYPESGGSVIRSIYPPQPEGNIGIYWFNGTDWIKLGGRKDPENNTIKIKSSNLGKYQIRTVIPASGFAIRTDQIYPRVITPNGDGKNDYVFFYYENPNDSTVEIKIYDVDGRFVRNVNEQGPVEMSRKWDGKDESGNIVPTGVYIYEITSEGKKFTGTVVVAK